MGDIGIATYIHVLSDLVVSIEDREQLPRQRTNAQLKLRANYYSTQLAQGASYTVEVIGTTVCTGTSRRRIRVRVTVPDDPPEVAAPEEP